MLTITARFRVRPEWTDRWPGLVDEFTRASRAEDGNLYFWWSRDLHDPTVFYLMEGYREDAVEAHLASPLIPVITRTWPQALVETPRMMMATIPGEAWGPMQVLPV
ncbi:putative quinol monooxygenase [Cryptosporangium phraense]|uniref:Antibiotic biosynthesis monooxygenase n=1 Tax=Cryptosporangium phraense TaxID=2593070 RepID=A0A545AL93_9ACTN|nr:putative quinol monooxygenase [Cryptosporangium phraense]TQS42089.1 antibiotic biosynthesis monooxygenase [Cryptosporangium phraense]